MNIYQSIAAIMADCPAIGKTSRNNQGQGYNYRGVDAVMNVFQPLLAKHHVFAVPTVLSSEREERETKNGGTLIYTILAVKYTFFAEDGSFVEAVVKGEAMDSSDKSSNKAMSAAFKYAMFQVFCIPTEEMVDPDAETPEESKPKEYLCGVCGKPFRAFMDSKGKNWTAAEAFKIAVKKNPDGVPRCGECYKKLKEGKKDENEPVES